MVASLTPEEADQSARNLIRYWVKRYPAIDHKADCDCELEGALLSTQFGLQQLLQRLSPEQVSALLTYA